MDFGGKVEVRRGHSPKTSTRSQFLFIIDDFEESINGRHFKEIVNVIRQTHQNQASAGGFEILVAGYQHAYARAVDKAHLGHISHQKQLLLGNGPLNGRAEMGNLAPLDMPADIKHVPFTANAHLNFHSFPIRSRANSWVG